jgi:hypothetical protein
MPETIFKTGKLPARHIDGLAMIHEYLTAPLPPGPLVYPAPSVVRWLMYGNDQVGDCTWAGILHARMAAAARLGEVETWPADQTVIAAYLAYNGGQDVGCCEADLLTYYQRNFILGDRCVGFAPVDIADQTTVKAAIALFGCAYIGVQLPDSVLPVSAGVLPPWTVVPDGSAANAPNPANGHCVIIVGYNLQGAWVVTWGTVVFCSWAFLAAYMDEDWAIITGEFVRANPGVVDVKALLIDLGKLAA